MIARRKFIKLSAAATLAAAGGAGLYTRFVEPHWLDLTERPLPIAHLPRDLQGLRLVQISDVHVGPNVDDAYLLESFRRVKALAPDFVVYTGDFTSDEPGRLAHFGGMVAQFPTGRHGTFGIMGNHDYGVNWTQPGIASGISQLAAGAGIRILRNEVAEVRGLHVVGLDDLWAHRFDPHAAFAKLPAGSGIAALALSHNPDTADLPGWENYSGWILAGHTHGGQCKPPFLPPPLLPVKNRRYTAGEFALPGGRRMYINRGLGHLTPVRFNVRPEITVFHLQRA